MLRYYFGIGLALCYVAAPWAASAEMSSSNYRIYADTIGVNGGNFSTSTSYNLQDTAGESPAGFVSSTSYELRGGYQAMERGELSMAISNSVINLGTLNASQVASFPTTVTIVSSASTGYTLAVSAVSGAMPASVMDGSVTAGSEEYGLAASGSNAAVSGDVAVSANTIIATAASAVANDATVLTFKASQASGSAANTYSQTITLTVSANF